MTCGTHPRARIRIGISGWRYSGWRGTFYPKDLVQRRELEYASQRLNSLEINGSFYSLQRPDSYRRWYEETPRDFVFAVKCSRFITHVKRLNNVETPLANFFASGVLALEEKLGPLLWQFPPNLLFNQDKFEAFFKILPTTMEAAAEMGRKHDQRLKARARLRFGRNRRLRHAIEIRHESFLVPAFFQQLRRHKIGFVVADTAKRFPFAEDVTADFVYCRLHGETELYASGYDDAALRRWAERVRAWSRGRQRRAARCVLAGPPPTRASRDVYVYFDNDAKVRAPFDAMRLAELLRL